MALIDYCYPSPVPDWEDTTAVHEYCGPYSPFDPALVDDWILVLDVKEFARGSTRAELNAPTSHLEHEWESASTDKLEVAFLGHAAKWERDTRYVSAMNDIFNHESYRAIIAMGRERPKEVLSLLLRDLKENERPWFSALAQIARTNPADPADAGRIDRLAKAWTSWGKKEGLL